MELVLGITGGVGAGKSRILEILRQEYGARIIQADQVAAVLEEPGEPGLLALTELFEFLIRREAWTEKPLHSGFLQMRRLWRW